MSIERKGQIARYEQFVLFSQCFFFYKSLWSVLWIVSMKSSIPLCNEQTRFHCKYYWQYFFSSLYFMVSKLSVVFKYLNLVYWHRFNCKTLSKKISYHLMNPFIQIPMISYVHEREERERNFIFQYITDLMEKAFKEKWRKKCW